MADYVTAIRTVDGDKQIDYNALANKPTAASLGAVPKTTTVNGRALSSNINLTASDVGAASSSTTVNGKKLTSNITLTASDVGAAPKYTYGETDLTAGSSSLTTGTLYFMYE